MQIASLSRAAVRRCAPRRAASLLTWGDGSDGQLGHTPVVRSGLMNSYVELLPRTLEPLSGGDKPVRYFAGGMNHSLCVDGDGAQPAERVRRCGAVQ